LGTHGAEEGQFNQPFAIEVTERRVFVTDSGNHRVQVFGLDGQFLCQWGSQGQGQGQFQGPTGLCVQNGVVYVADTRNYRVQVFDVGSDVAVECACPPLGAGPEPGIESLDQD
jgi:DNA-binding beta-propeller fold protein YncE